MSFWLPLGDPEPRACGTLQPPRALKLQLQAFKHVQTYGFKIGGSPLQVLAFVWLGPSSTTNPKEPKTFSRDSFNYQSKRTKRTQKNSDVLLESSQASNFTPLLCKYFIPSVASASITSPAMGALHVMNHGPSDPCKLPGPKTWFHLQGPGGRRLEMRDSISAHLKTLEAPKPARRAGHQKLQAFLTF